jgi:UrcA family protein
MYKTLFAASALSLAALTPALAETVVIPYNKAAITQPGGAANLHQKISATAETLCKEDLKRARWIVATESVVKVCVNETVDYTVRFSREPALKAYNESLRATEKAGPASATLAMR